MSSLVCELREVGDICVNVAVFHFQLLQFIVGFFMSSVVYKGLFKLSFHYLPLAHLPGEEGGVFHDIFKPFVLHFNPSFGVHSLEEREKVVTFFKRVVGYVCISIHAYEPFKLHQKWHCFASVSGELGGSYPFQSSILLLE